MDVENQIQKSKTDFCSLSPVEDYIVPIPDLDVCRINGRFRPASVRKPI